MNTHSVSPPISETREQAESHTGLYVALLVLFAGGLALFFFSQQSLRLDEAQSLWQTSRSPREILAIVGKDVHVPLYHLVLHVWRVALGGGVEVARALSLLFYLLSIPALYQLGKLAYNKSAGLFAATLLAISPFMNWYGSEIRMYTLFALLVILNQYCFLRILKRESDYAWIGYIATGVLGIFSHYFFFLALAGQAAFFFFRRALFPNGATGRFIFSWILIGLVFLPWIGYVLYLGEAQTQQPLLPVPSSVNVFNTFSQFLFGFQDDHLNSFFLSLWPVTIILGFLALRKTRRIAPETEYFMLSVIMAVSLAFVVSIAVQPIFSSRFLVLAIPSLYLLLTSLFSLYPGGAARVAQGAIILLMLVTLGVEMASSATPVKENYREAAFYLEANAGPQDVVILSAPFTVYPVEYYYRGPAPIETIPIWNRYEFGPITPYSQERLPTEVERLTKDHQYAWVLLSYDQGYEENVRLYLDTHFERVLAKNFSPGLNLYVYKLRYDTPLSRKPVFSVQD